MARSIFDFFPPPRFLQMAPVGFSISDTALRYVDLRSSSSGLKLRSYAEKKIPTGLINGGYVHNIEELTKLVREFRDEHGLGFVRASLPEEKAYLFKTEVPVGDMQALRDSIEFKIEENVPLSVANAVFDFTVLKRHTESSEKANHVDVIVSVLPIKVVSTYIEVFEGAGLKPISFQVESQAVSRAVIKTGDRDTYLVVNLGEEKTGLYVVSDEVVHYASTFALSKESTRRILEGSPTFTLKTSRAEQDASCDEFWMKQVADEIQKLFSYWHTHEDKQGELGKKISRVIIAGDHPHVGSCLGLVSSSVSVPVTIANVWVNAFSLNEFVPDIPLMQTSADSKGDSSLKYAASIGLAIPQ